VQPNPIAIAHRALDVDAMDQELRAVLGQPLERLGFNLWQ
jgi:hypothetical protein